LAMAISFTNILPIDLVTAFSVTNILPISVRFYWPCRSSGGQSPISYAAASIRTRVKKCGICG
jgi:hypothetical protein